MAELTSLAPRLVIDPFPKLHPYIRWVLAVARNILVNTKNITVLKDLKDTTMPDTDTEQRLNVTQWFADFQYLKKEHLPGATDYMINRSLTLFFCLRENLTHWCFVSVLK